MRCSILSIACCFVVMFTILGSCRSYPATLDQAEVVEIVPINDKETVETEQQLIERNKRTIGVLRQLFPGLSQKVDMVVQEIVAYLFRIISRQILSGGLFGGGGGGSSSGSSSSSSGTVSSGTSSGSGGSRVSITLPTYPPDLEGDDDDDDDADSASSGSSNVVTNTTSTSDNEVGESTVVQSVKNTTSRRRRAIYAAVKNNPFRGF